MATKPLTGTKVFLMLVAFFGVVIGVNVTMMKLAIATLPGTDVDSPYAAGLAYDREISAAQDQAARKWKVNAHIERRADGGAVLQVEARDASGQPIDRTEIRRPPGAADRQARRSRGRALGGRHRHLSRQCRIGRAGPVGPRHRGRGAGNARVHVAQPRDPELKEFCHARHAGLFALRPDCGRGRPAHRSRGRGRSLRRLHGQDRARAVRAFPTSRWRA